MASTVVVIRQYYCRPRPLASAALDALDAKVSTKAVLAGMTSDCFTLADPNDRGMLDVAGVDTTVLAVITDFVWS